MLSKIVSTVLNAVPSSNFSRRTFALPPGCSRNYVCETIVHMHILGAGKSIKIQEKVALP